MFAHYLDNWFGADPVYSIEWVFCPGNHVFKRSCRVLRLVVIEILFADVTCLFIIHIFGVLGGLLKCPFMGFGFVVCYLELSRWDMLAHYSHG